LSFVCLVESFLPFIFLSFLFDCSVPIESPGDENFFQNKYFTQICSFPMKFMEEGQKLNQKQLRSGIFYFIYPFMFVQKRKIEN